MNMRMDDARLNMLADQFCNLKNMTLLQFIEAVDSGRLVINTVPVTLSVTHTTSTTISIKNSDGGVYHAES